MVTIFISVLAVALAYVGYRQLKKIKELNETIIYLKADVEDLNFKNAKLEETLAAIEKAKKKESTKVQNKKKTSKEVVN